MEIIEFDLRIREDVANHIRHTIKITTAILLISTALFFISLFIHSQNIYLNMAFSFIKGISFSGMFLSYFHLKMLYIDYKVEKKHFTALKLNHTIMLQEKVYRLEEAK